MVLNHADMNCVYGCIGSMGALSVLLGARMSAFRLNGSPGENDPKSELNKWHLANQLNAEWAPVGVGLALALVLRGTAQKNQLARNLIAIWAASRWAFIAGLLFYPKMPLLLPAMTGNYATLAGMSAMLLCPSCV